MNSLYCDSDIQEIRPVNPEQLKTLLIKVPKQVAKSFVEPHHNKEIISCRNLGAIIKSFK